MLAISRPPRKFRPSDVLDFEAIILIVMDPWLLGMILRSVRCAGRKLPDVWKIVLLGVRKGHGGRDRTAFGPTKPQEASTSPSALPVPHPIILPRAGGLGPNQANTQPAERNSVPSAP